MAAILRFIVVRVSLVRAGNSKGEMRGFFAALRMTNYIARNDKLYRMIEAEFRS
jgi:hypothetical protein